MPYLPCENPNCKSYGKSHPNCRCFGSVGNKYADGGKVSSCSAKHNPDCEYFADGGDAIDPSKVVLDQSNAQSEINPNKVEVDPEIDPNKVEVNPEIDPSAVKLDNRYDTTEQQIKTGLEGAAQGFLGPLATAAELKMGIKPEDIAGRAATNPGIHAATKTAALIGSAFTPYGEAGAIGHVAGAIVPKSLPLLGSIGAAAVKGAIEMGLYQGGDEITKSMLAQPGSDPQAAMSSALVNIKNSILMGAATGGVFGTIAKGTAATLEGSKISAKLNSFIAGIGAEHSASQAIGEIGAIPEGALPSDFNEGVKFYREGIGKVYGKISRSATDAAAAAVASHYGGGMAGAEGAAYVMDKLAGKYAEKLFNKPLTDATKKYVIPAFLKAISSGTGVDGASQAVDYATNVGRGAQNISNFVEKIFKPSAQQTYDYSVSEKERQQLGDFIENGGVDQQIQNQSAAEPQSVGYAHGGAVMNAPPESKNHIESIFPAQNALISTTKARISNYLNSVRPLPNPAKAAFDKDPADADKKRNYKKALDIAIKPLGVLHHLHEGTLGIEEMQHANAMFPEVMSHLRNKISERVVKAQLNGETPSYRARQGMSLFLGQPVDSCLTPQAIQAAQNVFASNIQAKAQQMAPIKKGKKSTTSLSKASDSYMTANQSREARQNKV